MFFLIRDTIFLLPKKAKPVILNENDTFDLPIFVLFFHHKTFRIGKTAMKKFLHYLTYRKRGSFIEQ